jgi:hypothetical protein
LFACNLDRLDLNKIVKREQNESLECRPWGLLRTLFHVAMHELGKDWVENSFRQTMSVRTWLAYTCVCILKWISSNLPAVQDIPVDSIRFFAAMVFLSTAMVFLSLSAKSNVEKNLRVRIHSLVVLSGILLKVSLTCKRSSS